MPLFNVPERLNKSQDNKIAKKATVTAKSPTTVRGGGLAGIINTARATVEQNLGKYKEEYEIISEISVLQDYIDTVLKTGILAIDTETTGLNPLQDKLVGISIYTPSKKPAYIPVNHISYVTGQKCNNQLSATDIGHIFSVLENNERVKIIMFNACFDIRVLRHSIFVNLKCYWDCYLAARLMNENEGLKNNNLKHLHQKYCTDGEALALRFGDIFEGISFDLVPINLGYLYAAHDAIITYELYKFQEPYLTADNDLCIEHNLTDVSWVFFNVEMPCVEVIADMEDTGVAFDFNYAKHLHEEYTDKLKSALGDVYEAINMYSDEISNYRLKHADCKLSDPINVSSPAQMAILLYDIIGIKPVDKDSPRGTGEKILLKIDNAITRNLLKYRELEKLVSTYIDKLPECADKTDKRIHCHFNQYGADTGRMSSNDPNLQNIPSHNKDIRKMFVATNDCTDVLATDDTFAVNRWCKVETPTGYKCSTDILVGDELVTDVGIVVVTSVYSVPTDNSNVYYKVVRR